jgi:hypothetical protein
LFTGAATKSTGWRLGESRPVARTRPRHPFHERADSTTGSFPVGGILTVPAYRTARTSRLESASPGTTTPDLCIPRWSRADPAHLHVVTVAGTSGHENVELSTRKIELSRCLSQSTQRQEAQADNCELQAHLISIIFRRGRLDTLPAAT